MAEMRGRAKRSGATGDIFEVVQMLGRIFRQFIVAAR